MDEDEVQGDVILGFHKRVQAFLFFSVVDVGVFRQLLRDVIAPMLTSTQEVRAADELLASIKANAPPGTLKPFTSTQLAFTARGLLRLGISAEALPAQGAFLAGQEQDARANLADPLDGSGKLDWRPEFLQKTIDGVLTVTAPDATQLELELSFLRAIIGPSTKMVLQLRGAVRPGEAAGKEHFGFKVRISESA